MKKKKILVVVLAILSQSVFAGEEGVDDNRAVIRSVIHENEAWFTELVMQRGSSMGISPGDSSLQQLLSQLDNDDDAGNAHRNFLHILDDGRPMTNRLVVACYVHSLRDESERVRVLSLTILRMRPPPTAVLVPFEKDLIEAWSRNRMGGLLRLIGMLDTASSRKFLDDLHNSGVSISEAVRARTGDQDAARALVARFQKEQNPEKKALLARDLAYSRSPLALAAIAAEMRNPDIIKYYNSRVSLRYELLKLLSSVYPEEPLFSTELESAVGLSTRDMSAAEKKREQDKYFDRVEEWCERNHGAVWTRERPAFFLKESWTVINW